VRTDKNNNNKSLVAATLDWVEVENLVAAVSNLTEMENPVAVLWFLHLARKLK